MPEYIYTSPQILTDQIFLLYGGLTGTSSTEQREIAYTLAEEQMVDYLASYLTPTIVTGTFFWKDTNPLNLDYGNIMAVYRVTVNSSDWSNGCEMETVTGCHAVRNAQYGYLDVSALLGCGGCSHIVGLPPYTVTVVYQSGMATGTYGGKAMLQALTLAAQINLNEIDVSLSNEGTADIGIKQFSNQRYQEIRAKMGTTTFGNSAVANRVARLVRKYRTKPAIGFH